MFVGSLAALVLGVVLIVLGVNGNAAALSEYTDYEKELPQPGTIWIILGVLALIAGVALLVLSVIRSRRPAGEKPARNAALISVLDAIPEIFTAAAVGFTFTLMLATLLARSFPTAHVYVLGFSFYLATFLFYLVVAAARRLRRIPKLNAVWYRVLHFLISGAALYVFYFSCWPAWRLSMREVQGVLDEGVIAPDRVIFAYIAFAICYFVVIGLSALGRAIRKKLSGSEEAYAPIVDRK